MSEEQGQTHDDPNEILATVVMVDVVGFSKLEPAQQYARMVALGHLRISLIAELQERYRKLGHEYEVPLTLGRGDGWAWCFFSKYQFEHAFDLVLGLNQKDSGQDLRIGMSAGYLRQIFDDTHKIVDVAGDAINNAQRVMSVGDAGHVFCSTEIASLLWHKRDLKCFIPANGQSEFRIAPKTGRFSPLLCETDAEEIEMHKLNELKEIKAIYGQGDNCYIGSSAIPDYLLNLARCVLTLKYCVRLKDNLHIADLTGAGSETFVDELLWIATSRKLKPLRGFQLPGIADRRV